MLKSFSGYSRISLITHVDFWIQISAIICSISISYIVYIYMYRPYLIERLIKTGGSSWIKENVWYLLIYIFIYNPIFTSLCLKRTWTNRQKYFLTLINVSDGDGSTDDVQIVYYIDRYYWQFILRIVLLNKINKLTHNYGDGCFWAWLMQKATRQTNTCLRLPFRGRRKCRRSVISAWQQRTRLSVLPRWVEPVA